MIQTILLVIAVFLLVAFTHKLILKDRILLIQMQNGHAESNYVIDILLISVALSYIIWYCN